ncbi:Rid family hydrolase [Oligoflexus tunisiensis]|uniref:Rid family hydrolase n=1 Tax=Oligoflexus tunisiensis TaxID=708132 RepID=UPI00159F0C6A|nr:Rid family hydrolase [Oligoflexus tunisiensis]
MEGSLINKAYIVSGMPHVLLAPDKSPAWSRLRQAWQALAEDIQQEEADLILYYSTQWLSILGYMFQADPRPEWVHVDQNWHELGSIPYQFQIDTDFASAYAAEVDQLGYKTRLINYRGFPIDTGTIVAQKLLNSDNRLPAAIVSCNMYSEKEETTHVGQAAARALQKSGKKAVAVLVSNLSNRFHIEKINPQEDRVSSRKDDEWNRKILDMLAAGDVEDVAQTVREFARQANGDQHFKGMWWLNGLLGQTNHFEGCIYGYEPVWGTGAALVGLKPTEPVQAKPFESTLGSEEGSQAELVEELTDFERLTMPVTRAKPHHPAPAPAPTPTPGSTIPARDFAPTPGSTVPARDFPPSPGSTILASFPDYEIVSKTSAEPVGTYPHARRYGDLLFLSGIGPRKHGTKDIPGIVFDAQRKVVSYDIRVQTQSVIDNIKKILEEAGSSLDKVIDVQVFLTNMAQDFTGYNEVYNAAFKNIRPTRTTVEVGALPTPIAVEFKVIARP